MGGGLGLGLAGGGGAGGAADALRDLLRQRIEEALMQDQLRQTAERERAAQAEEDLRRQQLGIQGSQFDRRLGLDTSELDFRKQVQADDAPERAARVGLTSAQTADIKRRPMAEQDERAHEGMLADLGQQHELGRIKARGIEEMRQIGAQGANAVKVAGIRGANEPVYRIQTVDEQGNAVTMGIPRSQMAGAVIPAGPTADQRNRTASTGRASPVLQRVSELSAIINTKPGIAAKAAGGYRQLAAMANEDDDVAEYVSLVEGFTPLIARAAGHVGVLTEQDVERTISLLPRPGNSKNMRDRKVANLERILGGTGEQPTGNSPGSTETPRYTIIKP